MIYTYLYRIWDILTVYIINDLHGDIMISININNFNISYWAVTLLNILEFKQHLCYIIKIV